MLDTLNIKGAIVTADAMNSQRKIAKKISDEQGDDVLCIKANQKKLKDESSAYFHKMRRELPKAIKYYEETDSGHGRIEVRRYSQLKMSDWISEADKWSGIQTIIEVERERYIGQSSTKETQYYISSLEAEPERLAGCIRGHWEVENKAHWVLDAVFKEDDSQIRKGDGAENVGVIRRFCLNMARLHPSTASMRRKLKSAGWSDEFRAELLFGQN